MCAMSGAHKWIFIILNDEKSKNMPTKNQNNPTKITEFLLKNNEILFDPWSIFLQ
jgi:hypothetical protein